MNRNSWKIRFYLNLQNHMSAQRRLGSACGSAQLTRFFTVLSLGSQRANMDSKDSHQTAWMCRLIWIFTGRPCICVDFTLIRLVLFWHVFMHHITLPGRYPIHFHMCLNTSDSSPYIRDNSIHYTFARCVTIHGTHHVKVSVFAYWFVAHPYKIIFATVKCFFRQIYKWYKRKSSIWSTTEYATTNNRIFY